MATGDPTKPSQKEVATFHTNADTDGGTTSIHHTLGPQPQQASPGNHVHDGGNSPQLLTGFTLTGAKGGNVALASVVALLVSLGATDGTSA